jgi:hypothetical protein
MPVVDVPVVVPWFPSVDPFPVVVAPPPVLVNAPPPVVVLVSALVSLHADKASAVTRPKAVFICKLLARPEQHVSTYKVLRCADLLRQLPASLTRGWWRRLLWSSALGRINARSVYSCPLVELRNAEVAKPWSLLDRRGDCLRIDRGAVLVNPKTGKP